jgi:hypothetical protein
VSLTNVKLDKDHNLEYFLDCDCISLNNCTELRIEKGTTRDGYIKVICLRCGDHRTGVTIREACGNWNTHIRARIDGKKEKSQKRCSTVHYVVRKNTNGVPQYWRTDGGWVNMKKSGHPLRNIDIAQAIIDVEVKRMIPGFTYGIES